MRVASAVTGREEDIRAVVRKSLMLTQAGQQWYSKGMMMWGGSEPDKEPSHSHAEPRLGPRENGLGGVLEEHRTGEEKGERMEEESTGWGREEGLDLCETHCVNGRSLHGSHPASPMTQPAESSHSAFIYLQEYAEIMPVALQSFLVITTSLSAIPNP